IAPAGASRTATTTTTIHLREPCPSPGGGPAGGCTGTGTVASGGTGGTGGWVGSFDTRRLFYHRVSRSGAVGAIAPSFVSAELALERPRAVGLDLRDVDRRPVEHPQPVAGPAHAVGLLQ